VLGRSSLGLDRFKSSAWLANCWDKLRAKSRMLAGSLEIRLSTTAVLPAVKLDLIGIGALPAVWGHHRATILACASAPGGPGGGAKPLAFSFCDC
jgi:hypothetical protein